MDLSLREIFERARAAQEWVPPMEADLLFAAALRRAVELGVSLSPARVMLREGGFLEMGMQDTGPEPEEYRAPEMAESDPRRVDARAQVYAAGAVGYELFTGLPPPRPPHGPGPELTGPLGDVVRVAMAHDRRERFGDLQQLFDAVSVIEPHRSPPEERGLLAALLARVKRWEERAQNAAALALLRHEHESVEARLLLQERSTARLAELGERVGLLEAALQAQRAEQAAGLARLQQNLRELVEDRRREEARERELEETRAARLLLHPPRAPLLPVIAVALVAAVAASAAVVVLFERLRAPASPAPLPVSSPAVLPADSAPSPIAAAPPAPPLSADAGGAPPALASPLPPQANPAAAAPASTGPASAVSPSTPAPPLVAAPSGATAPVPAATTPAAPAPAADAHAPPPATAAAPAPEKPLAPLRADAKSAAGRTEQRPLGRARTLLNRGDSALEKGRTETAVNSFLAALESDPTLTEAHRGLGMAYAMQGNDAAAKKEYQLYLANSPGAADADDIRAAINELNQRSKLGP